MRALLAFVVAALGLAVAADAPAGTGKPTPLFEMNEGGDQLSFFAPETTRLLRPNPGGSPKVCQSDLPRNGNMWSGVDVTNAFAKPDVGAAFARSATFSTSGAPATFVSGGKTVTFDPTCKTCSAPGTDVAAFESMMRGVLMNRRLLCP